MLDFTKTLSDLPLVHPSSQVINCSLGKYTELGEHCVLEETNLGDYSYCFGDNDIIYSDIGRFASIATGVRLNPVQHPAHLRVAQHHFTYRCNHYGLGADDGSILAWRRSKRVTMGNDVWVGHNAVVMGGVAIGDGAVIGAGAVVTHDVAPYEIVGGVPARHIGWRFNQPVIAALARIRWWNWPHELLAQRLRAFDNVEDFCREYDPANKKKNSETRVPE